MGVWFNNPKELFNKKNILSFWPDANQSIDDRVNAASRFIIYAASIIYLIKRDVRVIFLAGMVIGVLYILYDKKMIREGVARPVMSNSNNYTPDCQLPTEENPMSNFLVGDPGDKPPACFYPTVKPLVKEFLDDTIPYDCGRSRCALPVVQRNAAARQFISAPVTTAVNDQTAFAEWCYGKKNRPLCRSDQKVCSADARGVQLEAFAGLTSALNPRSSGS